MQVHYVKLKSQQMQQQRQQKQPQQRNLHVLQ